MYLKIVDKKGVVKYNKYSRLSGAAFLCALALNLYFMRKVRKRQTVMIFDCNIDIYEIFINKMLLCIRLRLQLWR